jgi:hypothetical protein
MATFKVGAVSSNANHTAGYQTGKQFATYARCPTWAPSWAGIQYNYCYLEIFVQNNNSTIPSPGILLGVPADGKWYSLVEDDFPASSYPDDDDVWLSINTYGIPVDLDGIWVSSDY